MHQRDHALHTTTTYIILYKLMYTPYIYICIHGQDSSISSIDISRYVPRSFFDFSVLELMTMEVSCQISEACTHISKSWVLFIGSCLSHPPSDKPPQARLEWGAVSLNKGTLFSVVYFSRGTLPQKRNGKRALLGDLVTA